LSNHTVSAAAITKHNQHHKAADTNRYYQFNYHLPGESGYLVAHLGPSNTVQFLSKVVVKIQLLNVVLIKMCTFTAESDF